MSSPPKSPPRKLPPPPPKAPAPKGATRPVPPPFSERRAHRRVDLLAQVQLSQADEVHIMSTVNLSMGGVFLSGKVSQLSGVKAGMSAELLIFAPEKIHEDVEVRAKVVRVSKIARPDAPTGLAMEFVDIDQTNSGRLRKLLSL